MPEAHRCLKPPAAGLPFNGYGIGDYTAWYLTEYGFYIAATYRNVERIREGDGWNE